MTERLLYLVRHGEVDNPERIFYAQLPGFGLSERGRRMAASAADAIRSQGRRVSAVYASPLQRAQESAEPFAGAFSAPVTIENRIIEPANLLQGTHGFGSKDFWGDPKKWPMLRNPFKPSWGEPYQQIAARVVSAMQDAWFANAIDPESHDGDIVMVSHQAPIWIAHLFLAGRPLFHNPASRRCALSSITSFRFDISRGRFVEVGYLDPAGGFGAIDQGAV